MFTTVVNTVSAPPRASQLPCITSVCLSPGLSAFVSNSTSFQRPVQKQPEQCVCRGRGQRAWEFVSKHPTSGWHFSPWLTAAGVWRPTLFSSGQLREELTLLGPRQHQAGATSAGLPEGLPMCWLLSLPCPTSSTSLLVSSGSTSFKNNLHMNPHIRVCV